jgi:predicted phosphodiesterase
MIWDKRNLITKIQDTRYKQIPNFKFQLPKLFWLLINWLLVIIWLLFLGDWCFAFSNAPQITPETSASPAPKVATAESFSFVVFGDNRDGDMIFMDLIKKLNKEKNIAFAVNTGDFVSNGRESEYEKYLKMILNLKVKVYHVPGNHDLVEKGYKYYRKYMRPEYYFSFDHKNSHFLVLNNAFKDSFDAKQFDWLKKDLASTKKENIFVFMHRPTFDPTEIYKGYVMSGRETVKELMKVFKRYEVDYVFAGHLHGYARAERDGVIYVVTGGAGAPLYLPRDVGGFYHYVKIRVEGNKIKDEVLKIYE